MPRTPRPDMMTWCCVGLLAIPAATVLLAGASLILADPEALAGPAGIGVALGVFGFLPLLIIEYCAVVRQSRRATMFIASLALYGAIMGSIGWLSGLLDVLGLKSPNPDSMSPGEFVVLSGFLAVMIAVGLGHLRWHRMLRAASIEDWRQSQETS